MDNMEQIKFEAIAQALSAQRDAALNRCAMLEGELAVVRQMLDDATKTKQD